MFDKEAGKLKEAGWKSVGSLVHLPPFFSKESLKYVIRLGVQGYTPVNHLAHRLAVAVTVSVIVCARGSYACAYMHECVCLTVCSRMCVRGRQKQRVHTVEERRDGIYVHLLLGIKAL